MKDRKTGLETHFGPTLPYTLSCGHVIKFRIGPHDRTYVYCFRCEKYLVYYRPSHKIH